MNWSQLVFTTTEQNAEPLADILMELGALSVSFRDAEDVPVYEPALNTTPLWQQTQVVALLEQESDIEAFLLQLTQALNPETVPAYHLEELPEQQWERAWMADFHPMQFGQNLWICPSWQTPPQPEAVNIMLDPGLAFGTGTHQTTALCLQWLDGNVDKFSDEKLIDYGCGSGILAIAALKLGAKSVIAIDYDPQALIATQENAQNNGVDSAIQCFLPANYTETQPVKGVLANILAVVLIELVETLTALVQPQGFIVLSGILREQADAVVNAYKSDFEITEVAYQDNWARIVGIKKS